MSCGHAGKDCLIVYAPIRVTKRMAGLYVRIRNKLSVDELSVWIVLLHRLHSRLVAACSFIRSGQSKPNFVVLHDLMVLLLEQPCSLPIRRKPEVEPCEPRIRSTIGVLEHPIAEASGPPSLKKEFAHLPSAL